MIKCELCGTEVSEKKMHIHMRKRHPESKASAIPKSERPWVDFNNVLMSGQMAELKVGWELTNSELRKNAKNFEKPNPHHKEILLAIGYAFLETEEFSRAREFFRLYFSRFPDKEQEEGYIAMIDDIEDLLNNGAGTRDRNHLEKLSRLAVSMGMNRSKAAITGEIYRIDPNSRTLINYIDSLLDADRYQEALGLIETIKEDDRSFYRVRCRQGYALYQMNKTEEGLELLEQNLKRDRSYYKGWFLIGYDHYRRSDLKKALEYFNIAINANRNHVKSWYYKFRVYQDLRDEKMAKACYDRAVGIDAAWIKEHLLEENKK